MILTLEIPDSLAREMHLDGPGGPRRALQMLALEGYRSCELSAGQVGELLGFSFHDTEQFLHDHNAPGLTPEQNLEGVRNLERLLAR